MSMVSKFRPLVDRVLIRRAAAVEKSVGGILLPDAATKKLNEGEVVSVGPGGLTQTGEKVGMTLKVGDRVLLPEYGGTTIKLGEEEFSLFREDDILGVFDN